MAKTIVILDYLKEEIVKIKLSKVDEYTINMKFNGNHEEWLFINFEHQFDFNEIHWMVVDEVVEKTIERNDGSTYIGEILIDITKPENACYGMEATDGEYPLMLKFFDGYAVEVDNDWLEVPAEKDPVVMFYPTLDEVNESKELQDKIYKHTGRMWGPEVRCVYDVALTFGKIRRRKKYE